MALNTKSENVCRACLSTEGELVSLFPNNVDSSRITEKIMSVCRLPVRKEDGLPDKICKKCVYLVESFDCFKKQLFSADRHLKKLWDEKQNKLVEKIFIKKEFVPTKSMERDELDYDIEWISEEERILVEAAFKRKWAKEDKEKLDNWKLMTSVTATQLNSSIDVENKTIKIETPDNLFEDIDAFDPEEKEESMEKEAIQDTVDKLEDCDKSIKQIFIKKEKSDIPMEVDTNESEDIEERKKKEFMPIKNSIEDKKKIVDNDKKKNTGNSEIKIDPNVIIISDNEEVESCENRQNALCAITANSSRFIENENTSWKIQGDRKTPNGVRNVGNSDQALGIDKNKGSSIMKVDSVRKIRSKALSRKYFQCTTCRVNLYTVAAVLLHHNQIHTSPKDSLSCRMCDTKFSSKTDLFAHFNLHTESHLYRCTYCPNEFVLKNNLMRHMNDHKNQSCILQHNGTIQKNDNANIVPAIFDKTRENFQATGIVKISNNLSIPIIDNHQNTMDHEENCGKENVFPSDNSTAMIVENIDDILMEQDHENDNN